MHTSHETSHEAQGNNMRILVVEDSLENIEAAKEMLKNHELTILTGYDEVHKILKPIINEDKLKENLKRELPEGWHYADRLDFGRLILRDPEGELRDPTEKKNIWEICQGCVKKSHDAPFDIVITDVMIPKGGDACMNPAGAELAMKQGPMPYGPVIVLRALQAGIKKIGVLTSGNHHADPFVYAFDELEGFENGDIRICTSNNMEVQIQDKWVKNWAGMLKKLI